MAKTLVLKGTNFAANRLDVVSFENVIPCTGITLNESTKSVTSMSDFTLTATPTPADTTDAVVWSTSDAAVASVANGVVSPHSLGTVTITAICGEYSASCAVTIDNVVPDFIAVAGYNPYKRTESGNAMTTDKKTGETSSLLIVAANRESGLYPIESKVDVDTSPYRFVPILIPDGATKIIINTPNIKLKTRTYFLDSTKEETTYNTGGAYCVYGSIGDWDQGSTAYGPIEIAIPNNIEGLDSCCFGVAVSSAAQTIYADVTDLFTFAFSYDTPN